MIKEIRIENHGDIEFFAQIDNDNQEINMVNYNGIGSVPITQDEALYILEKLLDKDNQEIILKSQDSRSISSRLPIEIPLFTK
ncbi:hypothetical protein ACQJ5D_04865 [Helicobacter pylori]